MGYEVHLDVYDGPFNLLLQLITAQEVDLYEVRLADIVDAFVAEVARLETMDLEMATEFLLIAATLVELKCRRLLPGSGEVDLDEELALFEARDYLLARLVECRTFSEAANALAALEQHAARSHGRRAGPDERFEGLEPDLLAGVTAEQLAALVVKALTPNAPPVLSIAHVHEDEVSVAETMDRLAAELPGRGRVTLRNLVQPVDSTAGLVACFLAVLELYKEGLVELEQLGTFGEISVEWVRDAASAPSGEIIAAYVAAAHEEFDEFDQELDRKSGGAGEEPGPIPVQIPSEVGEE